MLKTIQKYTNKYTKSKKRRLNSKDLEKKYFTNLK